ncbi:MAG: heme biosynthesis HemY N-terminal domain-containing protein [Gammaproteobacteria bacterium]|jgi:HemY protein
MRFILLVLAVLFAVILVVLGLHADNGYALLSYGGWSAEMSLATLILLVVVGCGLLFILVRLLVRIWQLPRRLRALRQRRRVRNARRSMLRGMIDMAEGRWRDGERNLLRYVRYSETPLLNYLVAARAAQLQDEHERRDQYLRKAYEETPSATVAVLLTQAELQLAHRQFEHALATLRRLKEISPNHGFALKLLARIYRELGDWEPLRDLLPELRRSRAMNAEELERLELQATHALMERAAARADGTALNELWRELPRRLRQDDAVAADYARALRRAGADDTAEEVIRDALRNQWDSSLAGLYGELHTQEPGKQLARVEGWLKDRPEDPDVLLAAGRLCIQARLWGKARDYLEASLRLRPTAAGYDVLGRLLQELGELDEAREAFRKGLGLLLERQDQSNSSLPAPPSRQTSSLSERASAAKSNAS